MRKILSFLILLLALSFQAIAAPLADQPGIWQEAYNSQETLADVGLRVDGVVKDSGLNAAEILNNPLQDVNIKKRNAFTIPLTDTIALFNSASEFNSLKHQAFETMKSKGMKDRDVVGQRRITGI